MSTKKVQIGVRPSQRPAVQANADAWVDQRNVESTQVKMKRLTIDVPESLHRSIKAACAMRGTKIADEVRELLRERYGSE